MENIWKQDKESITKIKSEESEPPAKTMTITFKITRNPLKPKVNLHKLLKLKHSEKDFNTPKNESKDSNK